MTHALAAALLLLPSGAQAASPPPPRPGAAIAVDSLTLEEVIRHALGASTSVLLGRQSLADRRGALRAAAGPFDASLGLGVSRSRAVAPGLTPTGGTEILTTGSETDAYRIDFEKRTRWGLTVAPSMSVTRIDPRGATGPSTGAAALDVRLGLPLLRDRWGRTTRSGERAEQARYAGERAGLRERTAAGVLDAVTAYWSYVAAHRRLDVRRRAEQRAVALVGEMKGLVEADERPRADLSQARGNRIGKRIARVLAEQAVVEAQRQVVVAAGVDVPTVTRLPPPATPFPVAAPFRCVPTASERLAATAVARRGDLRAAAAEQRAAEVLHAASLDRRSPSLDLTASLGYEGMVADGGAGELLTPLASNVRGLNVAVGLEYRLPVSRSGATGAARRSRAAVDRSRIVRADLERRIRAGVEAACSAVERAAAAAEESDEAVRLARATVENEKTKLQLGMGTLFDVILAEDGLVGALLGRVDARRAHAEAVVLLRYESGTLIRDATDAAPAAVPATTVP